jgi:lysozyme
MDARQQLIQMEGWVHRAYPDPLTGGDPWTIGAGHTGPEVVKGLEWDDEQIAAALDQDMAEAEADARALVPLLDQLSEPRQAVLINMAFNLGRQKLSYFAGFLGAVRDQRWALAASCMLDSRWARQVPKRAARLARQLETDAWQ